MKKVVISVLIFAALCVVSFDLFATHAGTNHPRHASRPVSATQTGAVDPGAKGLLSFEIHGTSMAPTIANRDRLLVYRINSIDASDLKRQMVVMFRFPLDPREDFAKRIIGLPGDLVQVKANEGVWINNQKLTEPYTHQAAGYNWGPKVVPANSYFMLGDNRDDSYDSHSWGFLPAKDIIGEAVMDYTSRPVKFLVANLPTGLASAAG